MYDNRYNKLNETAPRRLPSIRIKHRRPTDLQPRYRVDEADILRLPFVLLLLQTDFPIFPFVQRILVVAQTSYRICRRRINFAVRISEEKTNKDAGSSHSRSKRTNDTCPVSAVRADRSP